MRPELLNPLFAEVTGLKGVGAGLARPLDKLGLTRIRDLVYHWPDRFVARRVVTRFDDAAIGENIVIAVTVREHRASAGRGPYRVLVEDAAGDVVALVYFGRASYSARKLLPRASSAGSRAGSTSLARSARSSIPIMSPPTAGNSPARWPSRSTRCPKG